MIQGIYEMIFAARPREPRPENKKDLVVGGVEVQVFVNSSYASVHANIPQINKPEKTACLSLMIYEWQYDNTDEYVNEINQSVARIVEAAKLLGAATTQEAA
jgi:hypothetical protein